MALTVLVGTVGMTVHKHYCGSLLVDTSVGAKAECCAMPDGEGDCCDNESEHFSVDSEFEVAPSIIVMPAVAYVDLADETFVDETSLAETLIYGYQHPPPIQVDVIVEVQQFLI